MPPPLLFHWKYAAFWSRVAMSSKLKRPNLALSNFEFVRIHINEERQNLQREFTQVCSDFVKTDLSRYNLVKKIANVFYYRQTVTKKAQMAILFWRHVVGRGRGGRKTLPFFSSYLTSSCLHALVPLGGRGRRRRGVGEISSNGKCKKWKRERNFGSSHTI